MPIRPGTLPCFSILCIPLCFSFSLYGMRTSAEDAASSSQRSEFRLLLPIMPVVITIIMMMTKPPRPMRMRSTTSRASFQRSRLQNKLQVVRPRRLSQVRLKNPSLSLSHSVHRWCSFRSWGICSEHDTLFREVKRTTGKELDDLPIRRANSSAPATKHTGPCLRNSSCGCPQCAGGASVAAGSSRPDPPVRRREMKPSAAANDDPYACQSNTSRSYSGQHEMEVSYE